MRPALLILDDPTAHRDPLAVSVQDWARGLDTMGPGWDRQLQRLERVRELLGLERLEVPPTPVWQGPLPVPVDEVAQRWAGRVLRGGMLPDRNPAPAAWWNVVSWSYEDLWREFLEG